MKIWYKFDSNPGPVAAAGMLRLFLPSQTCLLVLDHRESAMALALHLLPRFAIRVTTMRHLHTERFYRSHHSIVYGIYFIIELMNYGRGNGA